MALGKFCEACQAIPRYGFCRLAGCPSAPPTNPAPIRFDLALGACRVAANAPDLMTAQAFAQTAIDFLTGDYELQEDLPPCRTCGGHLTTGPWGITDCMACNPPGGR